MGAVLGSLCALLVILVLLVLRMRQRRKNKGTYTIEDDFEADELDHTNQMQDMDGFGDTSLGFSELWRYIPKVVLEYPNVSMTRV